MGDARLPAVVFIARIAIGLPIAFEASQYLFGSLFVPARIICNHDRAVHRIVVNPVVARMGILFFGIVQYPDSGSRSGE